MKAMGTNHNESLQNSLKQYGLNPTDWRLEPSSEEEYLIQSREDDDFMFFGKISGSPTNPKWQSIQLFSL
jgi:hypothetical protein